MAGWRSWGSGSAPPESGLSTAEEVSGASRGVEGLLWLWVFVSFRF